MSAAGALRYGELQSLPATSPVSMEMDQPSPGGSEQSDRSVPDLLPPISINSPLDLEVAEKLSEQLNSKQTSLTVDLEKQEFDLDTLLNTIKKECREKGISVQQEPIRTQLAQIHKLEMIRKEHARTLHTLREEYKERLKQITAKRVSAATSPTQSIASSPGATQMSPPRNTPPSRPIAVVAANVNPRGRPRVARQRSLQPRIKMAEKRRRTKSVIDMVTAPSPVGDESSRPPTVFNMMSQHMTVNMLAHPVSPNMNLNNHHNMTDPKSLPLLGSQNQLPHNSFPYFSNQQNPSYNMAGRCYINNMSNFYDMPNHVNVSNSTTSHNGQFAGLSQNDKFYHIQPDPTDPNLGKRMLRNLLMGEKQLNEVNRIANDQVSHSHIGNNHIRSNHMGSNHMGSNPAGSHRVNNHLGGEQCKTASFYSGSQISPPARHHLDAHHLQQQPPPYRGMHDALTHHIKQQPYHHQVSQNHLQSQDQQHDMSGSGISLHNPPAYVEEPPLNLDESLSSEIMQLDDQMLQASLDVTGMLPDQWENIQLTDEDYL